MFEIIMLVVICVLAAVGGLVLLIVGALDGDAPHVTFTGGIVFIIALVALVFVVPYTAAEACPHCEMLNKPDAVCCCECGEAMDSTNDVTIHITNGEQGTYATIIPPEDNSTDTRYCTNCGNTMQETYKFCNMCGTAATGQ